MHYANTRKTDFSYGWWVNAETQESFMKDMVELARSLCLFHLENKRPEEIVELLVSKMAFSPPSTAGCWCLTTLRPPLSERLSR